jgi:hypothetical protein
MFIAALLTITKIWNQHTYPSTDEWIKKMWYINSMEKYCGINTNEIIIFWKVDRSRNHIK